MFIRLATGHLQILREMKCPSKHDGILMTPIVVQFIAGLNLISRLLIDRKFKGSALSVKNRTTGLRGNSGLVVVK